MGAHNELQVVHFTVVVDPVRPKGHQARPARIGVHPLDAVVLGGVTPKEVHQQQPAGLHGQRALEGIDLANVFHGASDPTVHAQDLVLN
jgi:hypothetical protein